MYVLKEGSNDSLIILMVLQMIVIHIIKLKLCATFCKRFYNLILLGKQALVCNEKQNKIINARSRVESAAAARTEH